jgi:drug/metabolite transporter (DMT)-like permease
LKQKLLFAHLALFGANLIYAFNYGYAKDVMQGGFVPPFTFILFRAVGATLLFWITSLFFYEKIEKKDLGRFALCGFFGVTANQLMFFSGLDLTSTIHASIIMISSPIIVSILSIFMIKDKMNLKKAIGIGIGLTGALFVILHQNNSSGNAGLFGDLLIFLNASSYGLYLISVKPLMSKYQPITVIKWVFTFGLIGVIPFGSYQLNQVNWVMPNDILLKIGFVILFTTFFCYLFNIYGIKHVSPTIVSTYIYLQPILTSFIAVISGREKLDLFIVISSILIFSGVYLVSVSMPKKIN